MARCGVYKYASKSVNFVFLIILRDTTKAFFEHKRKFLIKKLVFVYLLLNPQQIFGQFFDEIL